MGRFGRVAVVLIGWVVIVMALDLGLGSLVELARGDSTGPDTGVDSEGNSERAVVAEPGPCLEHHAILPENETHAADPAVRDDAWSREYWCQFGRVQGGYVPYLFYRMGEVRLPYINSSLGARRSYEPAGLDADVPAVWFFGGSTTWGYAQRDDHTIPSEVARISERAGTPVRVVNFGQLSWGHWQEMLAFEQELAVRDRPDAVVFYDGVNDVSVQTSVDGRPSDNPTIYDFGNDPPAPVPAPFTADAPDLQPSLIDRWADRSALWHLARTVESWIDDPAGASERSTRGSVAAPPSSEIAGRRALEIYERGRSLSFALAQDHGVRPLFFLQPRLRPDAASMIFIEGAMASGPPTVDLTRVLDDSPSVFLEDSAHTNEDGARLVAEAMWPFVQEAVG